MRINIYTCGIQLVLSYPISSQHFAQLPICVKHVSLQYSLVTTVIHIQSLRSHVCVCVCVCVCLYIYIYVYIYICMYIYIQIDRYTYIYIYTHTHTHNYCSLYRDVGRAKEIKILKQERMPHYKDDFCLHVPQVRQPWSKVLYDV